MDNPTLTLIERRASTNAFDEGHALTDAQIEKLASLATRAPSSYHLQNWRLIAVRTPRAKARLRQLAQGQAKVSRAAVTFIVCGVLPDPELVPRRLAPLVDAGLMSAADACSWREGARARYADAQAARDEAIRSGTLAAATLMHAAEAMGLATGPMGGFDAQGVARDFELASDEVPVMLLAVGRATPANWPQKPRRPTNEVLQFA